MKVAFDGQIFGMQKYGGISRYFARLAEELEQQKIQTRVYAGYHINSYLKGEGSLVKGQYLDRYPKRTIRMFRKWNGIRASLASGIFGPDIVHETYFSPKATLKGKGPTVVTVYDMIQELFPERFSPSQIHTEEKRAALARADHIISISHNTKKDLCELFGTAPEKVSVTHLAADPVLKTDFKKKETAGEKPYFLYVGLRLDYKNFRLLAQAFAASERLMRDFRIMAFGGGGFNPSELEEYSRMGFKEGQLVSRGGSDEDLAQCYANAMAFVYPSLYEGFGIPPLEALSYSCPVVSSNSSSIPEVLGDAALYFDPFSQEELTRQLEKIAYEAQTRADLIKVGDARVTQFSWGKTAEETKAIYRNILGV
ncbi:glycosyltransferase family 4 protein [Algoriphagus sp. H41]|uniref:Glycosyltransferase family 4 protein n=1 Tax=Algoriphagus oliviformis TaxID=2811231 RepID=A0ABS3C8T5_9BACT|nr:glycosyltransferase family 1 protein [Algoriphagus oliviformis]MBN7813507.1 glycosyltransferase family 4 protein [Algoriphagus oliviformis]